MLKKCPKCGKDIKDEGAIYCPYCTEPLGKDTLSKRRRVTLALGMVFVFIGTVIVVLIREPKIDPNRMPFPEAQAELFYAGILNLVVGISFVIYGLLLTRKT